MPLPSRPFTDAYLIAYSAEHVAYEVDMFFEAVELRSRPNFTRNTLELLGHPDRINSLLIEGFVIHLRNLVTFLYNDTPRPTDIGAADFFAPGAWQGIRPAKAATVAAAHLRADKEISHLTGARQTGAPPEKVWDFVGLATELRPILQLFAEKANPAALSPRVARTIR